MAEDANRNPNSPSRGAAGSGWGLWHRGRGTWGGCSEINPLRFFTKREAEAYKVRATKGRRNVLTNYWRQFVSARRFPNVARQRPRATGVRHEREVIAGFAARALFGMRVILPPSLSPSRWLPGPEGPIQ